MRRKLLMIGVPVLVVLAVAGFAGWWFIIRDDAPAAVQGVEEQFATDTTVATTTPAADSTAAGTDATTGVTTAAAPTTAAAVAEAAASADGTWTVRQGENVFAGYRIEEEFVGGAVTSTAVGRSPAVSGTIEIAGSTVSAAQVEVDMTQLVSDSNRRDSQIRTGGLETENFPTATFVLTAPIDLGAVPTIGQVFTVTATGDLTMHGVTNSISLPLEARWTGDTVDLTGSTPIVLADYGVSMEAFAGTVRVAPEGTLELALQFVRA